MSYEIFIQNPTDQNVGVQIVGGEGFSLVNNGPDGAVVTEDNRTSICLAPDATNDGLAAKTGVVELEGNFAVQVGNEILPYSFTADQLPIFFNGTRPEALNVLFEEKLEPDEMIFITKTGNLSYQGVAGDVITLSDGTTLDVVNSNLITYSVPAGKHKVKLIPERTGTIVLAGPALVELYSFPKISTVSNIRFQGTIYTPTYVVINSPNLIKVPTTLPSNITDMTSMFREAINFNQPLSTWDVSNVLSFDAAFFKASSFNQPLNGWNVANATSMNSMFGGAIVFNQPLDTWDVSGVTDFAYMFEITAAFNQDISMWQITSAATLEGMFSEALAFNKDISVWDTSTVTNLWSTFNGATSFNQPLNTWNVSNVINMNATFQNATAFDQPLDTWNTTKVTNMQSMFEGASNFSQDLSGWPVPEITEVPTNFALNAPLLTLGNQPIWGTIPVKVVIDEAMFTKTTYVKTDSSPDMWLSVGYTAETATGKLYIEWGDGTKQVVKASDYAADGYSTRIEHAYATDGEYVVKVYSDTKAEYLELGEITSVTDWGNPENVQIRLASANLVEVPSTLHPAMTNLTNMFYDATGFNQDISTWDTSNVTSMSGMFGNAKLFNQPIGLWNVSKVTIMDYMFNGAESFNQDLSNWDVSNVTDMSGMFSQALAFNQNVSTWNVSNVTSMGGMYWGAISFNQDISEWDVTKVTNMQYMFNAATAFDQDLSQWCVGSIASLPGDFNTNGIITAGNLPVWGTCPVKVVIDDALFTKATYVQTDTSNTMWMTVGYAPENATAKLYIEWGDGSKQTLLAADYVNDGYDIYVEHPYAANGEYLVKLYSDTPVNYSLIGTVTKVTDWGSPANLQIQIESPNLIEVPATLHPDMTNLKFMFSGSTNFNQDISGWDTSKVTDMSGMFKKATIFNQDISGWNVSKVTSMANMFERANAFNYNLSQWCVGLVTSLPFNFALYATLLTSEKLPVWGTCPRGENLTPLTFTNSYRLEFDMVSEDGSPFQATVDYGDGFTETIDSYGDEISVSHYYDVYEAVHTAKVTFTKPVASIIGLGTAISILDWGSNVCRNFQISSDALVSVPTTIPAYVTSADSMFYKCYNFNQDLSGWNTTNITNMSYMFGDATKFNGNIGGWNVSNVTNMDGMFKYAAAFNQDISGWNISNVTKLRDTFSSATLFNQPLNSWNTSNVTDMIGTFQNATAFNQPLDAWDTSNVTWISNMFQNAINFNQDISGWNVSKVTLMGTMFYNAASFNYNLSQWCVGLIPSIPFDFATNATLFTSDKFPVWGTCPRGENVI